LPLHDSLESLIENDYAILRQFEGRSSLSTFLVVVIQRLLIGERTRRTGRWHPSRETESLGAAGIALERIVRRERRTIDEALPILQPIDPDGTLVDAAVGLGGHADALLEI
jgi:DNA-directed RNA polymerase specialized sigma24 family protein